MQFPIRSSGVPVDVASLIRFRASVVHRITVLGLALSAACNPPAPNAPVRSAELPAQVSSTPLPAAGSNEELFRPDEPASWRIVPGKSFGPVGQQTSQPDLQRIFGSANVDQGSLYIGEGFCAPASIVFPGADNELTVAWQGPEHETVAVLRVQKPGGRWSTAEGIRVGTTLAQLEKIKGDPIEFGGFGWDYGGFLDWQGLGLRLAPDAEVYRSSGGDPQFPEILGDRAVRSDHPLIRRMKIEVTMIQISFGTPYGEKECL